MGIANDQLTTPGVDDVLPRMGKDIAGFHFQCQHVQLKPVPVVPIRKLSKAFCDNWALIGAASEPPE